VTSNILRWKGGFAGDMVMYLMHLSGYKIANVKFCDRISESGKVILDFSHVKSRLSEIDRMALDTHYRDLINHDQLVKEIASLDDVWIKSHYYTDSFDAITTDIVVDAASLPFVISANVYKTNTMSTQAFHPLAKHISDPDVRLKLALYNVGIDALRTTTTSVSKIYVSDLLQGWQTLCDRLDQARIRIGPQAQNFYQHWYERNQQYFASIQYIDMIGKENYDHDHKDLTIAERYALMVLKGQRFQLLHSEKETA